MTGEAPSAKAAVEAVLRLAADGSLDDAETLCRERLAARPDDVNLVAVLGAVLLKKGELAGAEAHLERAVALEPAFARAHEDLGILRLAAGRPADAAACFETAVALNPRQASAFYGLATALERSGRAAEARAAQARFLALSPDGRAVAEALRLRSAGELDRAESLCGEVLARDPRNVHAIRLAARIAADRGRAVAAEGLLRRLVAVSPAFFPAYTDLAELFAERGRVHEAAAALEQAASLRPEDLATLRRLADTLAVVGRTADALAAYERLLASCPDEPGALLGRAHMLRIHGRPAEAIAAYRRCTELHPEAGDAWWGLAAFRGFAFTDAERQTMERQLGAAPPDSPAATALHFALAREREHAGDFAGAWQHYRAGNAAKRRSVSYDPVDLEVQHDARIRVFDERFMRQADAAPPRDGEARPIFIVGVPRSGSTLVEQILASHGAVEGCGELPYVVMLAARLGGENGDAGYAKAAAGLTADEWRALGDEYMKLSLAHRRARTPWFTDKMPANFGHLGFIRMMLPDAVFVDARRDPLDTCVANYRQLFAQGKNQSYDLTELGEYYLEYLRMMRHWARVMPGRVLTVQYEDVVADLEAAVRRLLAHCGLPFERACLRFFENRRPVDSASAEQVREPIYADAVGYWRHYESGLGELRQILAPVLPPDPPARSRI